MDSYALNRDQLYVSNWNPIIVPPDVQGSWIAMLAIFEQRELEGTLFSWDSECEYRRIKAQMSEPMATLLRQLSGMPLRDSFRIGGGLHGIGLLLPYDETRTMDDSRMVTLNVTATRQIEIRLLDCTSHALRLPILDCVICNPNDAAYNVDQLLESLPKTKVPMETPS